jgi:hypothetical protein
MHAAVFSTCIPDFPLEQTLFKGFAMKHTSQRVSLKTVMIALAALVGLGGLALSCASD